MGGPGPPITPRFPPWLMRKLEFVLRRLFTSLFVLIGVSIIAFFLARVVPSNAAALYIGPRARPEDIAEGTPVLIPGMGWKGTALGPVQSNGKVPVSVGALRVEVPVPSQEVSAVQARRWLAQASARK